MKLYVITLAVACGLAAMLCAQDTGTQVVSLRSTTIGVMPMSHPAWIESAACDGAGNVYLRPLGTYPGFNEKHYQAPVQKITPQMNVAAKFQIADAFPDGEAGPFSVQDGRLFVLAETRQGLFVVEFAADGSVKAKTKLRTDAYVQALHLAVFNSGEYLVVGVTGKPTVTSTGPDLRTPFTGVFAADGHLIKKVYEPEDEEARQRAEGLDPGYDPPGVANSGNLFVYYSADVTAGSDGNVYLLHGGPSHLIYVISPTGDVLRKFGIDTADPDFKTNSIKFYDGRLVIGFDWLSHVPPGLVKVVDLKGNSVADYKIAEITADSSPLLACYNAAGLTLIPRGADTTLHLLNVKLP